MRRFASVLVVAGTALVALGPGTAHARPGMHTLRVEGAGALQIGDQWDRYDFGGGVGAGYELRPIPLVGVELAYHGFWWRRSRPLPGSQAYSDYHALSLAGRLHPLPDLSAGDLWIDAGPRCR